VVHQFPVGQIELHHFTLVELEEGAAISSPAGMVVVEDGRGGAQIADILVSAIPPASKLIVKATRPESCPPHRSW
jgi:hypothetical protein